MLTADRIGSREHTQYLGAHAAIGKEPHAILDGFPDQAAGVDRIHAAEQNVAQFRVLRRKRSCSSTVSSW